jgi:putative peptide zinc metalloprotease protein
VSVIETRMSVWEALAGRAPGRPLGPADAGLWHAVAERLNPARAKPQLRPGIEEAELTTARGIDYVMLRSPDGAKACYLRLTPEELRLARLMDGTRTVARLVAEFARIAGRLAPDQVTRVVADLAGNRMLEELPVDAFLRLQRVHRRPWPARLGRGLLAAARGQRVVLASIDPLVGFLYKIGGRLLFTRVAVVLAAIVSLAGLSVFVWRWMRGDNSVFLASDSYVTGAIVLLGLNVFALACHEFGHALAAKHAGRRVPAAGFLVYFGIPSIFVDTTDVWMAGRKARIVTTATGPATGLVLAGLSQLVGLFYPDLAPWTFKLAFAWYLNALFNLNPFMALDGYYLLMDWLEVPNLRARGLAWVMARLRRRPPRFGDLDREGRLVALYGMLAVVWIAIAVNLAYRVYTDRVAGLVVGLWRSGWAARALLVAVLAGLAAPVVYLLLGWVAKRLRRTRGRFGERRLERDEPRRLSALRSSALRQLPVAALTQLAEQARWVHPRTGQQLVFAGAAQSNVYVVIDGALEARRPGDPTGSVRERVGAGGVVGLANALTGAPAALAWHTAGTTLLALPSNAVAGVVGPLPGPPPVERAELENLFAETPALAALSDEDRLGVLTRARPLALPPGAPVLLTGPADAVVVASGVLVLPTGAELRRGSMIGPYGDGLPGHVATARTAARVWTLPAVAGLPLLVGVGAGVGGAGVGGAGVGWSAGAGAPAFGAHPLADYPPLASPPGPPPSNVDDEVDRRFERKLWWLLILLLLFALFLTGTNLFSGPVWAEMPADRALLSVTRGGAKAHVDGVDHALGKGGEIYVHEGDTVRVANRSIATLTFRGGSVTVLCAGTDLGVGGLISEATQPIQPKAKLRLSVGKLLVGTQGTSKAFKPLTVQIGSSGPLLTNDGVARFAMTPGSTEVGTGVVTRGGNVVSPSPDADLRCGDGVALPKPGGTPAVAPSPSDSPSAAPSPSDVPSAAPSSSDSPLPGATTRSPTPRSTTKSPTKGPTAGPTPTTSPLPPANKPPAITWVQQPTGTIDQVLNSGAACNGGPTTASLSVVVTDDHDTGNNFRVTVEWTVFASGSNTATWRGNWYGSVGPVSYPGTANRGGTLAVTVTATDSGGLSASVSGKVAVYACNPNAIP